MFWWALICTFACVYWENSEVDTKYIQQTRHAFLVASAKMESLNEDCLQNELMTEELCSNLTANTSEILQNGFIYFCCAVFVNCWCACKNYKYEHFRNNEAFVFFWNTRTGTILGPHVCTNLFSCNANVLSNAARIVRKDLFWQRGAHESHPEFFSHARWKLMLLLQYWPCDSTPAL